MRLLIKISLFTFLFLIFSCNEDDNPVSSSSEVDVDWILLKYNDNSIYCGFPWYNESQMEGYLLLSIDVEDMGTYFDDGLFVPNQNSDLSYDLSDSFCDYECCSFSYNINHPNPVNRIIYNTDMNYVTFFYEFNTPNEEIPVTINLQEFELIDYR